MSTISCPHCGTPNREGSKFCNECGVTLCEAHEPDESPAPPSQEDPAPQAERPRARPSRLSLGRPASKPESPPPPPDPAQPWLRPEMDDADAATPPPPPPPSSRRLFAGLQGLLDPLEVAEPTLPLATPQPVGVSRLGDESRRHLRTLAGRGVDLTDPVPTPPQPLPPLSRPGWIALLIGLALGLPVLLLATSTDLRPHLWPGLTAAYATIDGLEAGSPVLIQWAYDPAHAGEMDLVAQPVIEHLLSRGIPLVVVSQLPGGPATARRLIDQAATALRRSTGVFTPRSGPQSLVVEGGFLPGGPGVLPLLGQDPGPTVRGATLPGPAGELSAQAVESLITSGPSLTLVFAAQAEAVQEWLEQVQPLNNLPVIAVVSAGADPILRPYLDSGQLAGLVSGFDGAFHYSARLEHPPTPAAITRLQVHAVAQDWGLWAILGLILAGNVQGLLARSGAAGSDKQTQPRGRQP